MNETVVFDASALLAFLQNEEGASEVEQLLLGANVNGSLHLITSVNWTEILYAAAREVQYRDVAAVVAIVDELPIRLVDVGRDLSVMAAGYKSTRGIGLADAYAAALAALLDVPLVTADADFAALEADGIRLRRLR